MSASKQKLLSAALVSSIVLSLIAFSGPVGAVRTTVDGPDEVTKPDRFTITSSVEIREDERVNVQNYTLTIRPEGAEDEEVEITFAPNGTVVDVDPERGVVGEGEIRVTILRKTTTVEPVVDNGTYGYGDRYGYDERRGDERVDLGYGYGYSGNESQPTYVFEIELDSKAFKHGDYEVFLTVNTPSESGLFQSNVQSFTVETPGKGNGSGNGNGDGNDNGQDNGNGKANAGGKSNDAGN